MISTGFGDLSSFVNVVACFSSHERAVRIRIPQLDPEICIREEICIRCVKEIFRDKRYNLLADPIQSNSHSQRAPQKQGLSTFF